MMKTFAGIIFLSLLLCHILGPSLAVLCMERQFEIPSPAISQTETLTLKSYVPAVPYANHWESADVHEGLYRIDDQLYNVVRQVQENDTLYVTLQMNASAWQRFSELSDLMQEANSAKKASSPLSTAIKLLNGLFKVYLPVNAALLEYGADFESLTPRMTYADVRYDLISQVFKLHSPPPETV